MYIAHAKNIAGGAPYADTGYIYNPREPIPPAYPPMFPILLAPIYRWFGLNLTAMKIELIALFLASLALIYLAFRRLVAPAYAVAIMALVGLSPYFWEFKDNILSDIPFLLFTYLTLFFISRAREAPPAPKRQAVDSFLAGLMALLAIETRSVGVVLVASVVVADLIRFKRPTLLTGVFLLPSVVLGLLPAQLAHSMSSYLDMRTPFHLPWALMNAGYYSEELRDLWRNGYTRGPMRAIFLSMNGFLLVGFWTRLTRGITVSEVFSLLYLAVIFAWPHYQGIRFFIPVIPLYLFYAVVGFDRLASLGRSVSRRTAFACLLVLIFGSYAARYTTLDYGPIPEGVERPDTIALFDYLRRETPPEAVCIFFKARLLALYTGRRSTGYFTASDEELLNYFDRVRAQYVILARAYWRDQEQLRPFVERHTDRLEPVYHNPDFTVYRLTPPLPT